MTVRSFSSILHVTAPVIHRGLHGPAFAASGGKGTHSAIDATRRPVDVRAGGTWARGTPGLGPAPRRASSDPLSRSLAPSRSRCEEAHADQRARQVEQSLQQVGAPLIADAEPAAAKQPGERALNHPPVAPQPLRRVDPSASKARGNAPSPQGATEGRGIVSLVGVEFGGTFARSSWLAPWTDDRGNRVDKGEQLGGVMGVGGREANGERDTIAIHHQVVLGARFASIHRGRSGLLAPFLARTLRLSRLARLQSTAASSPSQLRSRVCNFFQTPASCQSRSRRQQVVPLPQPSTFGRSRQGQPVRNTKMIPPSAARSGTRGRPPFGLGGSSGNSGSMASHRSSETSGSFIAREEYVGPTSFATRS